MDPDLSATTSLPGRREKRKQEIRSRIQDAAYDLFRDQGIEETSIEQVCAAADVARRTFYGYYPNKQALLRELSQARVFSTADRMINEIMNNHHSTRDRVSAMIDYMEANLATYTDIDRQLILVMPSAFEDNNRERDISADLQQHFRKVFLAGQQVGDLSEQFSADMLALMIVGTTNTVMSNWALNNDYPVFEKLEEARVLFDSILSGA